MVGGGGDALAVIPTPTAIPAKAGTHRRPAPTVIPAKAGIHRRPVAIIADAPTVIPA